jgi:hypothetical protein
MTDKIAISFDDENRIRVLDAEKFKETDNLKVLIIFINKNKNNTIVFHFLKIIP